VSIETIMARDLGRMMVGSKQQANPWVEKRPLPAIMGGEGEI